MPGIETVTPEELKEALARALLRVNRSGERVSIGLIVGNAGALVLVAGQLVASIAKPLVAAVILPSAWCFATGLLLASLSPFLIWLSDLLFYRVHERALRDLVRVKPWAPKLSDGLTRAQMALECTAAVAFAAGLLIPLVKISSRFTLALL